jgi:hypothetical protein
MTKMPWQKWFHADWLSDSSVGKCSLAARGLWFELLNLMMADNVSEISGTVEQIARMARCSTQEAEVAIEELCASNCATVTHSNKIVTLGCRRLQREQKTRENTAERVRRYRTKNACNAEIYGVEDRRQISEDRSQKKKSSVSDRSENDVNDDWIFPEGWDRPDLRKALQDWEAMRRRIRKPVRSRASTSKIFKQFESPDHLIRVCEICEANEWQGLKPEYGAQPGQSKFPAKTTSQRLAQTANALQEWVNAKS